MLYLTGFSSYFYVHNKISKIYIIIKWNIIKELFIWISWLLYDETLQLNIAILIF